MGNEGIFHVLEEMTIADFWWLIDTSCPRIPCEFGWIEFAQSDIWSFKIWSLLVLRSFLTGTSSCYYFVLNMLFGCSIFILWWWDSIHVSIDINHDCPILSLVFFCLGSCVFLSFLELSWNTTCYVTRDTRFHLRFYNLLVNTGGFGRSPQ